MKTELESAFDELKAAYLSADETAFDEKMSLFCSALSLEKEKDKYIADEFSIGSGAFKSFLEHLILSSDENVEDYLQLMEICLISKQLNPQFLERAIQNRF